MAKSAEQQAADAGSAENAESAAASVGDLSPDTAALEGKGPKPQQQAQASAPSYQAPRAQAQQSYSQPSAYQANMSQAFGNLGGASKSVAKDALIVGVGLVAGLFAVVYGPQLWKQVTEKK